MADRLMTICTYDERDAAERDCRRLRDAGLRAAVMDCLLHDPDQPGAALFDLVVFDHEMERAQELLDLFPPDPTEPQDLASFERAKRWARGTITLLGAAVLVVLGVVLILAESR